MVANVHILRKHALGLAEARKIAFQWAEQVEKDFGMACTYDEGSTQDEVAFTRSGVSGSLQVTHDTFELDAKLGFLLGAFKDRIEGEIVKNLDALLAGEAAPKKPAVKKASAKKK
jgi:putative polyhydroxyalkanoate system protein